MGTRQDPIETIAALLELAGAVEYSPPNGFPGRLFRYVGVSEPVAVVALSGASVSVRVEVAEPSPVGFGETWRIGAPVPTEVGRSADGEGESLWVSAEVQPDDVSLDALRALLGNLSESAATLNRFVVEVSAAEQEATRLWKELAPLGPSCSQLMRELGSGQLLRPGGNRHGFLERQRGWYAVGGYWPVAEPLRSLEVATRWLLGRPPPDCGHLFVDGDRIVLAGALGWVALAVEDRTLQPPGEESEKGFLEQLACLFMPRASKASSVVRESMPALEFGWLRPFLFEGSTLTGQGRVLRYAPESGTLEEDPAMSEAWRRFLRDPTDSAADQLMSLVAPAVDQILDRQLDAEATDTDDPDSR